MKNYLKILKYVILFQVISWVLFIFTDEYPFINRLNAEMLSMCIGIVILIVLLLLYFIFSNKIMKKNNYSSIFFNVSLLTSWILFSILLTYVSLKLVDMGVLHYCSGIGFACFLNGIEYVLFGFGMILIALIIILLKIIYYCYKLIRNHFIG